MTATHRDRGSIGLWLAATLTVLLFAGGILFAILNATHVEHRTCTVESKDRTTTSDGSSDARLYTEQCGVLHVGDSLLSWEFNSADTYASIDEGKTYDVTTRGYRIGFLSLFPNVVDATETNR